MAARTANALGRKACRAADRYMSQSGKGSMEVKASETPKSVVVLAHNRVNQDVFLRISNKYYHLRAQFSKGSTSAPGLNKKKVSHFNRSKSTDFDDVDVMELGEDLLEGHGDVDADKVYRQFLDNVDVNGLDDGLLDENGQVDANKVYESSKKDGPGSSLHSSYRSGALKTQKVARNTFSKIGQWYKERGQNHDVVTGAVYALGDIPSITASTDHIVGFAQGLPSGGNLSIQAGFRIASVFSVLSGMLNVFSACKEYFESQVFQDVDQYRMSLVVMMRGLSEITSGALNVSYRVLLLIGHAASCVFMEKLGLISTWIGSIYILLLSAPFAYSSYRGTKTIKQVKSDDGFVSVFTLNEEDKRGLSLGLYKKYGLKGGLTDLSNDPEGVNDFVERMLTIDVSVNSSKYMEFNEQRKDYLTDEDTALIRQKVQEDIAFLKTVNPELLHKMRHIHEELEKYYGIEVVRLKRIKENHFMRDFAFSSEQVGELRSKSRVVGCLTEQEKRKLVSKMSKQLWANRAIFGLCVAIASISIASIFITGGVPLVFIIVTNLLLNAIMLGVDFYYLYKGLPMDSALEKSAQEGESVKGVDKDNLADSKIQESSKPILHDCMSYLFIGLATIAATVVGVIFTKDMGLKILQGALGVLMLGLQGHIMYRASKRSKGVEQQRGFGEVSEALNGVS